MPLEGERLVIEPRYPNAEALSAMGAKDEHTLKAFMEAEAYDGPAIILAYSHCIAHGIDMVTGLQHQKAAVQAGQWLLYRFHPDRAAQGENPLQLDSRKSTQTVESFMMMENRFKMLTKSKPDRAKTLFKMAQEDADTRFRFYEYMAARKFAPDAPAAPTTGTTQTPA